MINFIFFLKDDFDAERHTNLSAVVSSLRTNNPSSNKDLVFFYFQKKFYEEKNFILFWANFFLLFLKDMSERENQTYELCYNSACIALSKGNEQDAYVKLRKAEKMCVKTFEEEQENPEDQEALDSEIAIIKVQLAYCLQRMGKSEEALKIYNSVVKTK